MESVIGGLYKTECIRTTVFHADPYRASADVEYASRRLGRRVQQPTPAPQPCNDDSRGSSNKPTTRPSTESRNPHKSGREPGAVHGCVHRPGWPASAAGRRWWHRIESPAPTPDWAARHAALGLLRAGAPRLACPYRPAQPFFAPQPLDPLVVDMISTARPVRGAAGGRPSASPTEDGPAQPCAAGPVRLVLRAARSWRRWLVLCDRAILVRVRPSPRRQRARVDGH